MVQRRRSKAKTASDDEDEAARQQVIFLSSSDDEDANEDLSLAIVERARRREAQRKIAENGHAASGSVMDLSLTSDDEPGIGTDPTNSAASVGETAPSPSESKKKKKRKKKKKLEELETVDAPVNEAEPSENQISTQVINEEPVGTADSVVTIVNAAPDNVVLRKLLRGPRYFDLEENNWETCFNCGEEGHMAANCTMEKRQRPCFVCGLFGHNAKHCTQGQDCYVCKRKGHHAKDCPDKNKRTDWDSKICLRCGDTGHHMSSCRNEYAADDLQKMQCYICKKNGHLCCIDFREAGPTEVSCFNCAQSGHTGLGCAKLRRETSGVAPSTVCYRCGEDGHFARGCTNIKKSFRSIGESSTFSKHAKESRNHLGFRSVPRDFGKVKKRKSLDYEDRKSMTTSKSKIKGGWMVDDPGDLSHKKFKRNSVASPRTPVKRIQSNYSVGPIGRYSTFKSPRKHASDFGTPNYQTPGKAYHYQQRWSASRFGNSHTYFGRT